MYPTFDWEITKDAMVEAALKAGTPQVTIIDYLILERDGPCSESGENAIKKTLAAGKLKDAIERLLVERRQAYEAIAEASLFRTLPREEIEKQLEDERKVLVAGLTMVEGLSVSTNQIAVHAALKTFKAHLLELRLSVSAPCPPPPAIEHFEDERCSTVEAVAAEMELDFEMSSSAESEQEADKTDGTPIYTVWYGTNRKMEEPSDPSRGFSGHRETDPQEIHYGKCEVAIPQSHKFGSVGSKWWMRWWAFTDDRLQLRGIRRLTEGSFWRHVNEELSKCNIAERQALVYLHGYNVTFNEAAIRAAQIGFDLKVPGVTTFFSWPSEGSIEGYPSDAASIEVSEAAITEFLVRLASDLGAERLHVIAHSMGNRGLLRAMQRIQADVQRRSGVKFGQVFLAAPDVDADLFRQLAAVYPQLAVRTTLYVSPGDKVVGFSEWLHGAPRAGFTPPVTVVPGIDTVEVPDFDIDVLGHSYYAEAEGVLHDMFDLLRRNAPPADRQRLQETHLDSGLSYWTMRA